VKANSTGGQGSRRAVSPSDDDGTTKLGKEGRSFILINNFPGTKRSFKKEYQEIRQTVQRNVAILINKAVPCTNIIYIETVVV
jgi:hypothetical protein